MFDLKGHVAVITGGNGGIGLGFGRGLGKAGASVAIWGRNAEKNAAAVAELKALGVEAAAFVCDVADEQSVIDAMRETLDRFGRVDSCFANAGIGSQTPFVDMTVDEWNRVLGVNLTGVFLTFREAVRHMIERGDGGKLIAVSSVGSVHGMPRQEHYSSSKAAVCAMVRSLAVECARYNIQANAILPGWIETDMTAGIMASEKISEAVLKRTPARRWGTPEDMEGLAVYLAAPESRFHTGDVLRLDGGYMVF